MYQSAGSVLVLSEIYMGAEPYGTMRKEMNDKE